MQELIRTSYDQQISPRIQIGHHTQDIVWRITRRGQGTSTHYTIEPASHRISPLTPTESNLAICFQQALYIMYPQLDQQDVCDLMEGKKLRSRFKKIILPKKTRFEMLEM